jgi:hypothetical protein
MATFNQHLRVRRWRSTDGLVSGGHVSDAAMQRGFSDAIAIKSIIRERVEAKGKKWRTQDSRPCQCGRPATRVWNDDAWCSPCYRKRGQ